MGIGKKLMLVLILQFLMGWAWGQVKGKPVIVIVHGAWGGSWAFKKVDSLLSEKGYKVYRPCLTGQGERVHLANRDIGLHTHIADVVNMILYEDIRDVVLVGHSYGGMVITGVADSLSGRIRGLVYLDAFVPGSGESAMSIRGTTFGPPAAMAPDGFLKPVWVAEGKNPPKDVPHPLKTLTDTLFLRNEGSIRIPTTYVLTVEKGKNPASDDFSAQADRARNRGWPVVQLEADHNPQWSAPEALAELLGQIEKNTRL